MLSELPLKTFGTMVCQENTPKKAVCMVSGAPRQRSGKRISKMTNYL